MKRPDPATMKGRLDIAFTSLPLPEAAAGRLPAHAGSDQARVRAGESGERQPEHRKVAAVHGHGDLGFRDARVAGEGRPDLSLQRVRGIDVALARKPEQATGEQHAGVLARAVVVQGRRRGAAADEIAGRRLVHRRVRAALEIRDAEAALAEHPLGRLHVLRLAPV